MKDWKINKDKYIFNLKHNFLFFISACAFFATFIRFRVSSILGVMLACVCALFIAAQCTPFVPFVKKNPLWIKVLSLLSTIGMILNIGNELLVQFDNSLAGNGSARTAVDMLGCSEYAMRQIVRIVGYCAQFGSCIAVFVGFVVFWHFLIKTLKELNCAQSIAKRDIVVASIFFCIEIISVIAVYLQGNNVQLAEVYSSDGQLLFEPSAFINVVHGENDLRQPLFGAFAAPFSAPLYLIGLAFKNVTWIMPVLLIVVQLILVIFATYLLADAVCGKTIERTVLTAFLLAVYPTLYNGFLIEQYMIAYWYLMLLVYAITKQKENPVIFAFAVGTLSPGVCIVPFMSRHNLRDEMKEWTLDVFKCCISFVCIVISLGRGDVILSIFSKAKALLNGFGSGGTSFSERILQYLNFVKTCIFTPTNTSVVNDSFQLETINTISIIGIVIFVAAILSFIINRKNTISQISFAWIILSFILCAIIGWGSTENIMPLYALYFFWAFIVLLFQLIRGIVEHIKLKPLKYALYITAIALVYVNNIIKMESFIDYLLSFSGEV